MNRRALISTVGTAIFAGCLSGGNQGSNNGQLRVNTEPVEPGETGTLTIRAEEAQYIDNGPELVQTPIEMDYDNVKFSTQPDLQENSSPPGWRWFSVQQNLSVTIPYHVPPNTQPNNYTGSISIKQDFESSTTTTEEYTITVLSPTQQTNESRSGNARTTFSEGTKTSTMQADNTSGETAATSPVSGTKSTSGCRKTPSTPGTAVVEADPIALTIENTTDTQQTVKITITPLPKSATARPSKEAPHEPHDLAESPVFFETTEIKAGKSKSYRCVGIGDSPRRYQLTVQAGKNLNAAYDWTENTYEVAVDITDSTIEYTAQSGE